MSGFFFTDVEIFPVLVGVALAFVFFPAGAFFSFGRTSSGDVLFFMDFREAFEMAGEASFRVDCLFMFFGAVTFNCLFIYVIKLLTQ